MLDEYIRSHPTMEVKHHLARIVLGWGTARLKKRRLVISNLLIIL